MTIPAHGSAAYYVTGTRTERTRYQAEEAWMPLYQEISGAPTARYETSGDADLGAYAGWLGDNPDNYMEWRDVYSFFGGKYRLTIAYASASARSLELYVNGELKRTFRNLNNGSWSSNWGKTNINIELQPGSNTIRLGSSSGFAPNIDYIQLRKTGDLDAVEGVKADSQEARAAWFGIDGKRHNAPRKGMNIKYLPNKNSKKVLVK